jgi:hypothetical protein
MLPKLGRFRITTLCTLRHKPSASALAPAADSVGDHAVVATTSLAPLRMLITRRTERHRLIGMQYLLSAMGFLAPQNFEGTIGKATVAAIKAFERAHDLPENAVLPDDLIGEVYKAAGKKKNRLSGISSSGRTLAACSMSL